MKKKFAVTLTCCVKCRDEKTQQLRKSQSLIYLRLSCFNGGFLKAIKEKHSVRVCVFSYAFVGFELFLNFIKMLKFFDVIQKKFLKANDEMTVFMQNTAKQFLFVSIFIFVNLLASLSETNTLYSTMQGFTGLCR